MTHAQWQSGVRRCLAMVERDPTRALKALQQLLSRVEKDAKKTVGDWHIEQTLEAISIVRSNFHDHDGSAAAMLKLADLHELQLVYVQRGFVSACATAALELASAGKRQAAAHALKRAQPMASRLEPEETLFRKAQQVVAAMPRRKR